MKYSLWHIPKEIWLKLMKETPPTSPAVIEKLEAFKNKPSQDHIDICNAAAYYVRNLEDGLDYEECFIQGAYWQLEQSKKTKLD